MSQEALERRVHELEQRLNAHLQERERLAECVQSVHDALSKLLQSVPTQDGGTNLVSRAKGQIKDGKVVQYAIQDEDGWTKYIGVTNNPIRREAEHRESGKMKPGDKLVVQSRALAPHKAKRLEAGRLQGHRRKHGRNPQHNVTNDGQFHDDKSPREGRW